MAEQTIPELRHWKHLRERDSRWDTTEPTCSLWCLSTSIPAALWGSADASVWRVQTVSSIALCFGRTIQACIHGSLFLQAVGNWGTKKADTPTTRNGKLPVFQCRGLDWLRAISIILDWLEEVKELTHSWDTGEQEGKARRNWTVKSATQSWESLLTGM